MAEQPDWAENLKKAVGRFAEDLGKAVEDAAPIFAAQGAMGWMMKGDMEQARSALAKLPADKLREVSAAAFALSSLADEIAAEPKESDDGR